MKLKTERRHEIKKAINETPLLRIVNCVNYST